MKFSNVALITLSTLSVVEGASADTPNTRYTQYITKGTEVVTPKTGKTKMVWTVNGININISPKEKIKAKAWHITEKEYAKYKYIMEYTPRGDWTPKLDPPIVLGNNADTEAERMHYAQIENDLEYNRRFREGTFQLAGIKDIDERMIGIGNKPKRGQLPAKGKFSKNLPAGKYVLRSLFVDMKTCNRDCENFVLKQMLIVGTKVQMDVYVANGEGFTDAQLYKKLHINAMKVVNGDINMLRSNEKVKLYQKGWTLPFVIQRDDKQTIRYGLNEDEVHEVNK